MHKDFCFVSLVLLEVVLFIYLLSGAHWFPFYETGRSAPEKHRTAVGQTRPTAPWRRQRGGQMVTFLRLLQVSRNTANRTQDGYEPHNLGTSIYFKFIDFLSNWNLLIDTVSRNSGLPNFIALETVKPSRSFYIF
jgi:hypothetical protein